MRTYANQQQTNWDTLIPCIMMALRSTPCESTGFSPHYLLFGREMTMPIDTSLIPKDNLGVDAKIHIKTLLENLKVAKSIAKDNIGISQEAAKERHDKGAKQPSFAIQDEVLLYNPTVKKGKSSKLTKKWHGPYYITEVCDNFTYKLRSCETHEPLKSRVHANRLKPFNSRRPKQQINTDQQKQESLNQGTDIEQVQEEDPTSDQSTSGDPSEGNSQEPKSATPSAPTAEDDTFYPVERILKVKQMKGNRYYLIKWTGDVPNSWQPRENLDPQLLQEYHVTHTIKGRRRRKGPRYFRPNSK